MREVFSYDNPVVSTIMKIGNMILLSVLWFVCCLPIFTAGAATAALYYAIQKWLKYERGYAWTCFFDSFRDNFKMATKGSLLFLFVVLFLFTDFWIVRFFQLEGIHSGFLKPVFLLLIFISCVYAFWYFASVARFCNTFGGHLKNAGLLMGRHAVLSLGIAGIELGAGLLLYLAPYLVFLLPVVSVWLMGQLTEIAFRRYMTDQDKALEDERNMIYGAKRKA